MPRHLTLALAASALLLTYVPTACAQASAATPELRAEFQRASGGDSSATDKAEAAFRRLVEQHPADPVARAYHGAALTLQGRDAWMPWTKLKKVELGLTQIDKALAAITPAHEAATDGQVSPAMETRLTAIGTQLALPAMFHRFESARALIKQSLANPALAALPAKEKARLYAWAAEVAEKSGEKAEATQFAKLALDAGGTGARP